MHHGNPLSEMEIPLPFFALLGFQRRASNGHEHYILLIRLAMYPAPNPLSMLTTATPEAQEFSMARRAVTPPKLVPYPMLVGTATTGRSTNPPTTLGSAPSIPATTMRTRAVSNLTLSERRRWIPATPTS